MKIFQKFLMGGSAMISVLFSTGAAAQDNQNEIVWQNPGPAVCGRDAYAPGCPPPDSTWSALVGIGGQVLDEALDGALDLRSDVSRYARGLLGDAWDAAWTDDDFETLRSRRGDWESTRERRRRQAEELQRQKTQQESDATLRRQEPDDRNPDGSQLVVEDSVRVTDSALEQGTRLEDASDFASSFSGTGSSDEGVLAYSGTRNGSFISGGYTLTDSDGSVGGSFVGTVQRGGRLTGRYVEGAEQGSFSGVASRALDQVFSGSSSCTSGCD